MHDEKRYRDLQGALSRYAVATRKAAVNYAAAQALVNEGHDVAKDAANAIGELLRDLELAHKVAKAHGADMNDYELVETGKPARLPDSIVSAIAELDRAARVCSRSRQHIAEHYKKARMDAINGEKGFAVDLIDRAIMTEERIALIIYASRVNELIGQLMNESVDLK